MLRAAPSGVGFFAVAVRVGWVPVGLGCGRGIGRVRNDELDLTRQTDSTASEAAAKQ